MWRIGKNRVLRSNAPATVPTNRRDDLVLEGLRGMMTALLA